MGSTLRLNNPLLDWLKPIRFNQLVVFVFVPETSHTTALLIRRINFASEDYHFRVVAELLWINLRDPR